jgi:hypothetical protein
MQQGCQVMYWSLCLYFITIRKATPDICKYYISQVFPQIWKHIGLLIISDIHSVTYNKCTWSHLINHRFDAWVLVHYNLPQQTSTLTLNLSYESAAHKETSRRQFGRNDTQG